MRTSRWRPRRNRHLVARHAGPRADEAHGRRHHRGREPRAAARRWRWPRRRGRRRPTAQRVHLPRVRAVGDGIGHGERFRSAGRKSNSVPAAGASARRFCAGAQRKTRSHAMTAAPAAPRTPAPPDPAVRAPRRRGTTARRRCRCRRRARDGARHERGLHAIGEQLEARHVGARPADAGDDAGHPRAPGPIGERREPEVARHREADARQVDRARVDRSVSVTRKGTDTVYAA
jgi:hypothetical protein